MKKLILILILISLNVGYVFAQKSAFGQEIDNSIMEKPRVFYKSDMFAENETEFQYSEKDNKVGKNVGGFLVGFGVGYVITYLVLDQKDYVEGSSQKQLFIGVGVACLGGIVRLAASSRKRKYLEYKKKNDITINIDSSGVGLAYGF